MPRCAYRFGAPEATMVVRTATSVLHDTRTRCSTPCDGRNPVVGSMAILIVGTEEFEPLVTFSSHDPYLCLTFTAMIYRTHEHMNPFICSRIPIWVALLLPEGYVRLILLRILCWSNHQAAVLHEFLHEHPDLMLNFCWLQ